MAFKVELRVEDVKQVQQGLEFLFDLFRIKTREAFRQWGPELVDIAVEKSPEDKLRKVDKRRRPKSEQFKTKWRWEIETSRDPQLNVGNVDPRMPIIVGPTPAVEGVTGKTPLGMIFYSDQGGPFQAWVINKPATPGQPVHEWAIETFDLDRHVRDLANNLVVR